MDDDVSNTVEAMVEDFQNAETIANPYPFYRRLQVEQPLYWRERSGAWFVTRYADVTSLLNDPRLSAASLPRTLSPVLGLANTDPPDHTRLRKILSAKYMHRVHEGFPEFVQQTVSELMDGLDCADGPVDFLTDLARVVPTTVNARLIGIPPESREQFKSSTEVVGAFLGGLGGLEKVARTRRASRRMLEEIARFRDIISQRRRRPENDLISAMVQAQNDGLLGEEEVLAICMEMLFAGQETATDLIGNGLLSLLRHPAQLQRLRDDPALIKSAVEELLRFESPVQMTTRLAVSDIALHGKVIQSGQKVALCLGAANRDPAQFTAPDNLDVARTNNRHVAFGYGIHYCMGAALARIEAQTVFAQLIRGFRQLRLASEQVEWKDTPIFRGLKSLPVVLER